MNDAMYGEPLYGPFVEFMGSFFLPMVLAIVWLAICRIVPPLRERLRVCYGIAMAPPVLSLVDLVVRGYTMNFWNFSGALLCVGLIFWRYRFVLGKSNRSRQVANEETP